jgi:hypothetical protein
VASTLTAWEEKRRAAESEKARDVTKAEEENE